MSDGPWIDTHEGVMWTYRRGKTRWDDISIRNDALWEAKFAERTEFVKLAHQWMLRAIYDDWIASPTYGDHEEIDRAWTLEKNGFKILGLSRPGDDKTLPTASVHIWGPDRLAIKPPLTYDMAAILRGAEMCSECCAHPVVTTRVGFAGRYCTPCAAVVRPQIETRGWTE